ncbi:MAG: ShlB/FhaC/HecB family hemolysin secretion/activation protein [Candidatus Thiodiazotropha sp. (ex Lucinoma aequizonata)]|nr:ShlB/FhaC/HecB family hemolysin secretion/activation protein [Candidatus Thiodiazotropha sp. (ex Lucinoma aequizonata)]MCU7886847.1 ShlB/FhaC/HecB family hemolysin secretion/activation protein [Candidatus Thiodiazotropha sp. (ex Lucinoma aequizonata)]MCU7894874.1 ShlB/FhaC/HecB family hemolysin secretion/activation protein [Candidatus Thiodiazotropha sp. (ex Lucinoma aequizonata)]MCU7897895.1 ShlB/FhaC/HecB family hemolysin secretion/activation protein [Candidatus Thiodiazotropha sp. (ex Luci
MKTNVKAEKRISDWWSIFCSGLHAHHGEGGGESGLYLSNTLSLTMAGPVTGMQLQPHIGFDIGWVKDYHVYRSDNQRTIDRDTLIGSSLGLSVRYRSMWAEVALLKPLYVDDEEEDRALLTSSLRILF